MLLGSLLDVVLSDVLAAVPDEDFTSLLRVSAPALVSTVLRLSDRNNYGTIVSPTVVSHDGYLSVM